jgi:hypothetical protein
MSTHSSRTTTDHDEIRRWAEARGGKPARVKGTGSDGDVGMIRLDFPGYSGSDSLEPISWDDWFAAFDENRLALVYQESTPDGQRSNFNKLIARETADARSRGESHASRHYRSSSAGSGRSTEHDAQVASSRNEDSLKEREYRDQQGEIHHHTRKYIEEHDT